MKINLQSFLKIFYHLFPPNNVVQQTTSKIASSKLSEEDKEVLRAQENERTEIMRHFQNLITNLEFKKMSDFLLGEGSEKSISFLTNDLSFLMIDKSTELFLSKNFNEEDLLAFIQIFENPTIRKQCLNALHLELNKVVDSEDYLYYNFPETIFKDELNNSTSQYSKIIQKMFSMDKDGLKYLGLSPLSAIEKRLVEVQFTMIEDIHENINFKEQIYHTNKLPVNDLLVLAFLHERPNYHSSPLIFKSGNTYLTNNKSGLSDLFYTYYQNRFSRHLTNSEVQERTTKIFEDYILRFKKGGIMEDVHQTLLKKFQAKNGNDMDAELSAITLPEKISQSLKEKYSEILNIEKTNKDVEFSSFLKSAKKTLLNFVQIYPNLEDLSPNIEENHVMLKTLIDNIDKGILNYQQDKLLEVQQNNKKTLYMTK